MSISTSQAADRCLGIALFVLAAFCAAHALSLNVPFSYDPVGPKAFPLGLSVLLGVLSLVLIFRPGLNGHWPDGRLALKLCAVLAMLLIYALLFSRLGYAISSCIVITLLARLFSASWRQAIITGVLMALGSYWLFTHGLDITLPSGTWLS